jgi:transposase
MSFPIVAIQEAGLDGFWLHRLLESEGVESHVVDPASIATPARNGNHMRLRPKARRRSNAAPPAPS